MKRIIAIPETLNDNELPINGISVHYNENNKQCLFKAYAYKNYDLTSKNKTFNFEKDIVNKKGEYHMLETSAKVNDFDECKNKAKYFIADYQKGHFSKENYINTQLTNSLALTVFDKKINYKHKIKTEDDTPITYFNLKGDNTYINIMIVNGEYNINNYWPVNNLLTRLNTHNVIIEN